VIQIREREEEDDDKVRAASITSIASAYSSFSCHPAHHFLPPSNRKKARVDTSPINLKIPIQKLPCDWQREQTSDWTEVKEVPEFGRRNRAAQSDPGMRENLPQTIGE
jgi:hypothetical protein